MFSSNLIRVIHISVLNIILFNEFQTSSFAHFGDDQPCLVILHCPSFAKAQVYLDFPRKHSFKHCFKKMVPQELFFSSLSENKVRFDKTSGSVCTEKMILQMNNLYKNSMFDKKKSHCKESSVSL